MHIFMLGLLLGFVLGGSSIIILYDYIMGRK